MAIEQERLPHKPTTASQETDPASARQQATSKELSELYSEELARHDAAIDRMLARLNRQSC
jgi:hypothetical protein